MSDAGVRSTQDIALAAYICMRGEEDPSLGVTLVKVNPKGPMSEFFFRDSRSMIDQLAVDFEGSGSQRFDAKIRVLKTLGRLKKVHHSY